MVANMPDSLQCICVFISLMKEVGLVLVKTFNQVRYRVPSLTVIQSLKAVRIYLTYLKNWRCVSDGIFIDMLFTDTNVHS